MSPEEEQIWRGIQQKDGQVFENYYKAHYRFFFLASCQYLKDPGVAQEIVNDVFIKLWEDAATIDIHTSLKFYIHRAVVNRSLNELDRDRRDRQRQQQLGHAIEETTEWKEMEGNELKIRLYKAIDQLPEQCRKVFNMSRFEGLKQQEIADKLGISIKTVKNHITRALKELHEVVGDWNALPVWIILIKEFFWPWR
ncbi:RNA polymerase sigma-70 factor [Puia dinghuensis]|uniref:DNA-directed RNA polymerase sigma-70 factor n=1 Tax=Puia dinghuensis TaxID=1792502 RepID=A0A8J2XWM7_9BACT|nr:RNA polymerase sigma-70 factor [Puia dinghuensis]GGB21102.1 DNA-directed RNA polymerase sigma-70 factor [Puia dinghuensis]